MAGEVDLATAPALRAKIDRLILDGNRRLLVGLEGVGFMDSSGLSALLGALKAMQEAGGRLAVAGAQTPVLKVFTISGLDRVFAIHGSVAEAVAT